MGGPYNIPRNYKGEGKILYIFSPKALGFSAGGLLIGLIFFFIFKMMNLTMIGIIIALIFAGLGFVIATFKMPNISKIELTTKTSGENIDTIILRWIKFKQKHNRIYVYKDSTKDNEEVK